MNVRNLTIDEIIRMDMDVPASELERLLDDAEDKGYERGYSEAEWERSEDCNELAEKITSLEDEIESLEGKIERLKTELQEI